jgi:hypothetical protein
MQAYYKVAAILQIFSAGTEILYGDRCLKYENFVTAITDVVITTTTNYDFGPFSLQRLKLFFYFLELSKHFCLYVDGAGL